MSSILKALKKIEREESHDGKGTPAWPDSVHSTRQTVAKESRKKVVIFSLVLVCCAVAAILIYKGRKTNLGNKTEKTASIPENQAKKKTPEFIVNPKQMNRVSNKAEPKIEKNQPAMVTKKSKESSLPVTEKANPSFYAEDDDLPDRNTRIPEQDAADTERALSLPKIKSDSRIDIQAIAWAEEPGRRFAVINNSIIREGGSIDGITIVSIEGDMVLFNENGNEWRQLFVVR